MSPCTLAGHRPQLPPPPAPPRRRWPRWSDLFYAPCRLIALAFLVLMVVTAVGLLPALGLCALLLKESYGPFTGEGDSVYWIASTFDQHAAPYLYFSVWGAGLVTLAVLTFGMDRFWSVAHRMNKPNDSNKPTDPFFDPFRLEVWVYRLLTAAGFLALLPLPLWVSFTAGADRPPEVVCLLSKDGVHLRGSEVIPGEPRKETTTIGGGSGMAVKVETKEPDRPAVPPPPPPITPEQIQDGKLGEKADRLVPWKDVATVWFTSFKDNRAVLHWTDPAGREEWIALPDHIRFTPENLVGWRDAVQRFAPHVLLLGNERRLLWPVLDAAAARGELQGRLKKWDLRGLTIRGKVRQVKVELDSWHKKEEWRKVTVVVGGAGEGNQDAVRCEFGQGWIPEEKRKEENARLDRAAALQQGQEAVIRGTVINREREVLEMTECHLLDTPAEKGR